MGKKDNAAGGAAQGAAAGASVAGPWGAIVGGVAGLAAGWLGSESAKEGGEIESAALLEQARIQDRRARDQQATSIDYTNEQRDIGLMGSEPYRNAGALALAGMMDMTGLDRGSLPSPQAPGGTEGLSDSATPAAMRAGLMSGVKQNMAQTFGGGTAGGEGTDQYQYTDPAELLAGEWETFEDVPREVWDDLNIDPTTLGTDPATKAHHLQMAKDRSREYRRGTYELPGTGSKTPSDRVGGGEDYRGRSSYDAEVNYDMDRLNDPSRIIQGAEKYDFKADPSYQWRLDEGMRGLENRAAARGGLLSGGFAKDAINYAGQSASQEFGNIYSRLAGIAGYGGTAGAARGAGGDPTAAGGQASIEAAGGIGAAGGARALGQVQSGNSWANAINQGAGMIGYGMGNGWLNQGGTQSYNRGAYIKDPAGYGPVP